jgi:hypothetical protein
VRPRSAAALAVSAVLAAAPSTASAASPPAALDTSYPCYSSGESVLLSGSGFTPQGTVTLSAGGQQLTTIDADLDGGFTVRVQAPDALFGTVHLRFVATDRTTPALSDGATVRIADTDVVVTPEIAGPSDLRRIRGWGFFGADAVYAHVKRHGAARARNIRLGSPRGACGTLNTQRRLFPHDPRPGAYTLQFDTLRRYYPHLDSSVSYSLGVFSPVLARASDWTSGASMAALVAP